jgi:putative transposase
MPYWRLFYHLVWATRGREPILVDEAEATTARVIRLVGDEVRAHVIAVGMVPDHIHVVASIPPSIAIAEVVKRMKGRSARLINHDRDEHAVDAFGWQPEYGVLSFGESALSRVVDYVNCQPERHATNDLWPTLEQMSDESARPQARSPERTSIG